MKAAVFVFFVCFFGGGRGCVSYIIFYLHRFGVHSIGKFDITFADLLAKYPSLAPRQTSCAACPVKYLVWHE